MILISPRFHQYLLLSVFFIITILVGVKWCVIVALLMIFLINKSYKFISLREIKYRMFFFVQLFNFCLSLIKNSKVIIIYIWFVYDKKSPGLKWGRTWGHRSSETVRNDSFTLANYRNWYIFENHFSYILFPKNSLPLSWMRTLFLLLRRLFVSNIVIYTFRGISSRHGQVDTNLAKKC